MGNKILLDASCSIYSISKEKSILIQSTNASLKVENDQWSAMKKMLKSNCYCNCICVKQFGGYFDSECEVEKV